MKARVFTAALLLSAAFVTPSYANWFHNPYVNVYRNIGSAPNPTPADVRENRLPIVAVDQQPVAHPILDAIRSMFSGRSAQAEPQNANGQRTAATPPR